MGAATRCANRDRALIGEEAQVTTATEQRPEQHEAALPAEPPEARHTTERIVIAVACLLGAQFLHWSVIDQHAREWGAAGDFFFALALIEGLLAVLIIGYLRPWVAAAGIVVSAVPVCIWIWDRTLGLPVGPTKGVRGTIGRSDVMSVVFEVLTVVVLWPFLHRSYGERARARVDLVGKVVIGATCVYVAGFSVWAMLGDQKVVHHVATTNVTVVDETGQLLPVVGDAPLNTSAAQTSPQAGP